jgi:DNA-binding transcriptional MerR regulator
MIRADDTRYGIQELVQLTGVPRRTIRYYVQRGLLEPPLGAGRGHYYTEEHLGRLRQIRDLQSQGLRLDEILGCLERGNEEAPAVLPPVELATRIFVAPGLEILVSHGARAPSPAQLRALAAAARKILSPDEGEL